MPETDGERESKEARAKSVERTLNDEPPPQEPPPQDLGPSRPAIGTSDVGESVTRRGEDVVEDEGKEPGRAHTGTEGATQRPTGESKPRDVSGVDSQGSNE